MRCFSPHTVSNKRGEKFLVNCGKCPYCKKRRVNSWVFRMLQEEKVSFSSYFITLTYAPQTVPAMHRPAHSGRLTLNTRDWQLFMKRLRKKQKSTIKYYACGEYGSKTWRPHFHAILFNVEDIEYIHQAWQLGTVVIGDVTGASIAYTTKYIDKIARIPQYKGDDRQPEKSYQSKGLGKSYITPQTIKYHRNDVSRMYVTLEDGVKVAMPRYYRDLLFTEADKKQQNLLIQALEIQENLDLEERFAKTQKNNDITFERWLATLKSAKYHKFYSHQKRDTL